ARLARGLRQREPVGRRARPACRRARRGRALAAGRRAMSGALHFDPIRLPPECVRLRQEVREFLRDELDSGRRGRREAFNREFSRKVGAKGWIGKTWPQKYGEAGPSHLERYVVTEEFLAARAPVRLHFVADRQSGPVLLRYAPEHIKA